MKVVGDEFGERPGEAGDGDDVDCCLGEGLWEDVEDVRVQNFLGRQLGHLCV